LGNLELLTADKFGKKTLRVKILGQFLKGLSDDR